MTSPDTELGRTVEDAVRDAMAGNLLMSGLVTTVLAFALILGVRFVLIRRIKGKREILDKEQRRWINRINNGASILAALCVIFIWAPQLHTFALSLTAVAVAVVLVTKELLMCLTGGFLRAASKPFDVGDWVTIDGLTGEVMRITAMTTLLQEVDMAGKTYEFTGRTIQVPNSKFLTANVENANFIKHYIFCEVPVCVQYADVDPAALMQNLQDITETYFAPLRDAALIFNKKVEKKAALDFAGPEPQFSMRTTELGHFVFTARLFVPTRHASGIAADVTRDFLSAVYKERLEAKGEKEE
jgi:small-conductance mechanosensitive channel